jgi:hypothetical protein
MKVQLGHIVQNLFHTGSLNEVPVSKLQELAETHPYFGPGHLLLSQKLKHEQSSRFETQIQKTALYFHDPLWLHWQLDQHEKEVQSLPEPEEQTEPKPVGLPDPEPEVQPGTGFEPGQDPAKTAEPEEGTGSIYEPDSIEPPAQPNPEADPPPPALTQTEPDPEPEPEVDEPKVEDPTTEPPANLPGPDTQQPAPVKEPIKAETGTQVQSHTPEPQITNHTPETSPAFEPYHTVDYFASQGIKISAEVQPTDRLGKQLKSFTEWLKTMKRLPQTGPNEQIEENADQDIRRIAAGSLEEKEVVTETMAEVLLKQDKRNEAIAIYEKLSLLDPSKRAYFAAKIENLKEN